MKRQSEETSIYNLGYIEALHDAYRRDRESVAPEWQTYFESGRNGDTWPQRSTAESSFRPTQYFQSAAGSRSGGRSPLHKSVSIV